MSSNPPPEPAGPPGRRGAVRLLPRSLTTRLILTTILLIALVSAVVCIVTTVALHRYLVARLDDQVGAAAAGWARSDDDFHTSTCPPVFPIRPGGYLPGQ